MNIEINKDFLTEYKDEFWKGFSAKEVFTIVAAGAVAAGVVIFLNVKFGVRPSEAVYAAIPFTIPILLVGFYKYQGYMPFKKLLEEISYSRKCRELHFESKDNEMIEKRRFRIGISLPHSAQGQYDMSTPVAPENAKPGDLVFFHSTYETEKYITHVGIYAGEGIMFEAGGGGVKYTDFTTAYWVNHFVGFGRVNGTSDQIVSR